MTLEQSIIRLATAPEGFADNVDELSADMFASPLPIQHSHDYFADEELGLYIGVWDTTDMTEAAAPYGMDEFMVLIEGAAVIQNNKTKVCETVLAGESFIIPKGYDCQWQQEGYLRKFYVIADNEHSTPTPASAPKGIIKFPEKAVLGDQVLYQSADQQFVCGAFKGAIADSPITTSSQHCFVYLKQGTITLIDHNLTEHHFKTGDAFIVLKGAQLGWRTNDEIMHHYVELSSK